MENAMHARDPFALTLLAFCLTVPSSALPVIRIARAGIDHHSAATVASDTADYIRNSAIGDMFEIAAAEVAKKDSRNNEVRRFAQMIIDDHTAIKSSLASTLKQAEFAMTLPASLDDPHAALIKQLERTAIADFDVDFIRQQIVANESALRVQASYATSGRDLSLRKFASQTVPKIQMHLTLAERIFRQLRSKTASARR